jgi:thiamine kinase-like enzyme
VLRYEVEGRWVAADGSDNLPASQDEGQTDGATQRVPSPQHERRTERQIIYGKVAADERGKWVGVVAAALHRRLRNVKTSRRFLIPRILGYRPNLRLILLESIPGVPRIAELIQSHLEGAGADEPGALTLEQALHDCAHIAFALHKAEIKLGKPRTFDDELASLQAQMEPIQEYSLALAMQLQKIIRQVQVAAEQTRPLSLVFSHGDFTYTQLIFADQSCGLVDFDTSCEAEPALDLGQFLAYVRLAGRKAQQRTAQELGEATDELCARFLNAYIQIAGYHGPDAEQLRARVAVYEVISLLRIAQHSWQKLKGSRLELVIDLLEERITCLPRISQKVDTQHNQSLGQRKSAPVLRTKASKTPVPANA